MFSITVLLVFGTVLGSIPLVPLFTLAPLVLETNLELSASFVGEKGGSDPESGGESGRFSAEVDATVDADVPPFPLATE